MSWLHCLAAPNQINVLRWVRVQCFVQHRPIVAGSLLLVTAAIIFVANAVRDPVRPRLIGFELAPTPGSALHILDKWREQEGTLRARNAIWTDFLVLPFIVALISYLCFWAVITVSSKKGFASEQTICNSIQASSESKQAVSDSKQTISGPRPAIPGPEQTCSGSEQESSEFELASCGTPPQPWLALIGELLGWSALVALLCGWAGNVAMLVTIAHQGTTSVFLSRFFASLKYGILAFAVAFLLCWLELIVYGQLLKVVKIYHAPFAVPATLAVLFVASALTLLKVRKLANTLHPSLLMLQFAPSRDAANRLLARWSAKRRRAARRANWFDMLFAILFTVTLAFFFFGLKRLDDWPLLSKSEGFSEIVFQFGTWANPSSLSWCVGWFMLLAGTCQVAQDLGAWAALREGEMGWWIRICRSLGAVRFALLFLGCLWVGVLVLLGEAHVLTYVFRRIHITV